MSVTSNTDKTGSEVPIADAEVEMQDELVALGVHVPVGRCACLGCLYSPWWERTNPEFIVREAG